MAVLVGGATSVPKTTIYPPQPRTQVPSWKYSVGHVFESARSSFTRPKDSSAKDDARTTTPDDDGGLEGRPYSQRPTPSYSSTPTRPATPPPTPPRGEAAAPAAPPPAPVVGAYAAASSGSSCSVNVSPDEHDLRSWDEKLETSESLSPRTLLRVVLRWPMMRDPPGDDGPEFPALAARALCGSLAGMSGAHLTPDLSAAVALAGLTSIAYELSINTGNACRGVGGRLDAAAFLATSALAKYQGVRCVGRKQRRGLWRSGAGPSSILASMILYHMLGAVATILLRESSDDSAAADPVRASSVVGLLGSLFLRDPTAVLALYGGSFVGMSLPSRLMHGYVVAPGSNARSVVRPQGPLSLLGSFAGAGALAGLFHAMTIRHGYWNGGWGGKAGLCAFAGCWVYRGFGSAFDFLSNKRK